MIVYRPLTTFNGMIINKVEVNISLNFFFLPRSRPIDSKFGKTMNFPYKNSLSVKIIFFGFQQSETDMNGNCSASPKYTSV